MIYRATLRWLVWGCCLAVVLLGARSASAAVPMCDERGASAIAPAPLLAVRDVKLEAAPLACDEQAAGLSPAQPRARGGLVVITGDGGDDAWIQPTLPKSPRLRSTSLLLPFAVPLPPSADYRLGVFRPPRA